MQHLSKVLRFGLGIGALSLAACAPSVDSPSEAATSSSDAPQWNLTIAHINDHHSHLAAQETSIKWQGEALELETGGFARVHSQIEAIRAANDHTLALHAGDAMTGTLYYTLFDGAADAALMNELCFDAMSLGNHEFDNGDAGLKTFLDYLALGDCGMPVLGANVKPEIGVSSLTPKTAWDSFKPLQVYQFGSEQVAVIGLDIAGKTKQSSQPDATTEFLDEAETAQVYIDKLQAQGVGKIILLTHYQYKNDLALAKQLTGVDAIIGGDSHTLLGEFSEYDLPTEGAYPTKVQNANGEPVCVAHAYQYGQVVGELKLSFEGDAIAGCGGRPHYLVSMDAPAELDDSGVFTRVAADAGSLKLLENYSEQVDELTAQTIAQVEQRLCLKRMGPATTEHCGVGRQSDAHRVVAEAFLASTPQADFALQNGGGVRSAMPAGEFSMGAAYQMLPFANTLVTVEISGAELKQVLEQALAYAISTDGSDGAYPHGAGVRFAVDMSAADGERVTELSVQTSVGEWATVGNAGTYTMVTNSFLADGSDGWAVLGEIKADGRVEDTYINYAQSFIDWLKKQKRVMRPAEHSTLSFTPVRKP